MAHVALYSKWRPQTFEEVVGQDFVVRTLSNAIRAGNIVHAYLFAGPRGTGKTSVARILAKAVNCAAGPTPTPDNTCPSCLSIAAGTSVDVVEIDAASNRGIDDIRELRDKVAFSPVESPKKVYIIDEAHMLTEPAWNALLKTLEEPPPHVKFIFATTQPQKILPTIISRCQFLPFQRISNIQIIEKLKEIAQQEKLEADEDVFLAIAKAADGSLRDAESILDELVSFSSGAIHLKDVNSILGVVEQEFLFEITDKIIKKDSLGCLQLLDTLIDQGKDPNQLLLNLIEHLRNLMIVKAARHNYEKLLDLPKEVCEDIVRQSQEIALEDIMAGFNVLLTAQEMARRIDGLRIPLEIALVKLSSPKGKPGQEIRGPYSGKKKEDKDTKSNDAIASENPLPAQDNYHKTNDDPAESKEDPPQIQVTEPKEEANIDFEKVKELWPVFMEKLNKVKVSAAHYLEEGSPLRASGAVLTIEFPKRLSFHKEALERKENRLIVEDVWKGLLEQDIKINFSVSYVEESPKRPAEDIDPAVKSALDTFNGRVVRKG